MHLEFIHSLPTARSFQDRPELSSLTNWWRDTEGGVCALIGLGGSGKTALIDRFLRLLPGVLASKSETDRKDLRSPDTVIVYSFDADPKPESMLASVARVFQVAPGTGQADPSYTLILTGLQKQIRDEPDCRHLVVLDALENLQEQRTAEGSFGLVRDDRVRDLLERCALGQFPGVYFLVSSRIPIANLEEKEPPLYLRVDVSDLTVSAAVSLMRARGVTYPEPALRSLVNQLGCHALSIDLLACYLVNFGEDAQAFLDEAVFEDLEGLIVTEVSARKRGVLRLAQQHSQILKRYRKALAEQNPAALALLERASLLRVTFDQSVLEEVFTGQKQPEEVGSEVVLELTGAEVGAALSLLVELGLLQVVPDGVFAVHPVVRQGILKEMSPTSEAAGHERFRRYLAGRFEQIPQDDWGHTRECLDLMEAYVVHTIEAGYVQDAWFFYWSSMGGFVNLGVNRADYARGARICSYFVNQLPPEAVSSSSSKLGPYERDFWIEWARYLRELGHPDSAERCLSRAERLPAGSGYGAEPCFLESERAEILILRGKLQEVLERIGRCETETALKSEEGSEPDEESRDRLQVLFAHAHALRGNVEEALSAFRKLEEKWDCFNGLLNHSYLYEIRLLDRLGRSDEVGNLLSRVTAFVYSEVGTWNTTLIPHWDLFLARELAGIGDLEQAEALLKRGRQFAISRGTPELLCQAALVRAHCELARIEKQIGDQSSYDADPLVDAFREMTDALDTARSYGFGLDVIDILVARARLALYLGWSFDALRDAEVAIYEGCEADPKLGLPVILPAADPGCNYRWAEAEGSQVIAEAVLLDAAQFLGCREVTGENAPEISTSLARARRELVQSQELREQLGDPQLEATHRLLQDLDANHLSDYPLTPLVVAQESKPAPGRIDQQNCDIFISYNSKDRKSARWISKELRARSLAVWLDEREIRAGVSWESTLDHILRSIPTALILIGQYGLSGWQKSEVEMLLIEKKRRGCAVIPIRLPGAPEPENLPLFLPTLQSVDLTDLDVIHPDAKVIDRLVTSLAGNA